MSEETYTSGSEREQELTNALREELPELRERIDVMGSVLPQVTTHNTSEWAKLALAIVDRLAALAPAVEEPTCNCISPDYHRADIRDVRGPHHAERCPMRAPAVEEQR